MTTKKIATKKSIPKKTAKKVATKKKVKKLVSKKAKKPAAKKSAEKTPPKKRTVERFCRVDMRCTPEEKKKFLDAAKKAGMTLTAFVLSRA